MKFGLAMVLCLSVFSSIDAVPCKDCDLSKKKERLAARMAIDKDDDIILDLVRDDGRCGPKYQVHGHPGQCNWQSKSPCCSREGWCGNAPNQCKCRGCFDYRTTQILWFCGVDFRDKDGPAFRSRDQRKVQRWLRAEFDTSRGMLYMHGYRSLTRAYWMDYRGYGQDILDPEVRHFTNKCFNAGPPDEK